jgi:hypothetical protein
MPEAGLNIYSDSVWSLQACNHREMLDVGGGKVRVECLRGRTKDVVDGIDAGVGLNVLASEISCSTSVSVTSFSPFTIRSSSTLAALLLCGWSAPTRYIQRVSEEPGPHEGARLPLRFDELGDLDVRGLEALGAFGGVELDYLAL